jgi:uncharacterized protein
MSVWALADLHLSFGVPDKEMGVFGAQWVNHPEKIKTHWLNTVSDDDLVLLPGDISWAMKIEEVKIDLDWIHHLPGTKVMIRGNHDYWWQSLKKIGEVLPPSIHIIQHSVFVWKGIAIGGSRLWDTPEYSFGNFVHYVDNPRANILSKVDNPVDAEKIFERELLRLEASLKQLPKDAKVRIAMTHYPPIGSDLKPSRASALLEKYKVSACAFGHLHNIKPGTLPFGEKNGVKYTLAAADYIDFTPVKIL